MEKMGGLGVNVVNDDIREILSDNEIQWNLLKDKKIFITGSTGFIMNYFIRMILEADRKYGLNCKVIAYCRNLMKAKEIYCDYYDDDNISFLEGTMEQSIIADEQIDYIVHSASPANPFYWFHNPIGTIITNVQGTNNILEFARANNVKRTLVISSAYVYGDNDEDIQFSENNINGKLPFDNPKFCYNESKRVSELLSQCFISQYDMDVAIARPFIIYGPGTDINRKTAFSDFVTNVMKNQDIVLKSDGSAKRDYCYISDCVSGLLYIMLYGNKGEAYNIANSGETLSIRQLAEKFSEYSRGNSKLIVDIPKDNGYLSAKSAIIRANTEKIEELGWRAKISMSEGIRRTVNYMQNRNSK